MPNKIKSLAKVLLSRLISDLCLIKEKNSISFEDIEKYLESYRDYKPSLCACMGSISGLCYCRASSEIKSNLESLKAFFSSFNTENFKLDLVEQELEIPNSYFNDCKEAKIKQSETLFNAIKCANQ